MNVNGYCKLLGYQPFQIYIFLTMNLLDDLEDILKNVAIDFHNIENTMEVNGYHQLSVYQLVTIIQSIFVCVQQKNETHRGLEQLEGG